MDAINLTGDAYYSLEADRAYMSCSQYQGFLECEAKAVAKLQGRWTEAPKEAFDVGNYFHSFFEGAAAHAKFCEDHFSSIYKTKTVKDKATGESCEIVTGKYAPYIAADKMIDTVKTDPTMKKFLDMDGENEKAMIGYIFGVPWRMKMDKYVPAERYIIDYKTTASIYDTTYNPFKGMRESFIEAHGYIMRAAVYSMIEMQTVFGIGFDEAFENLAPLSSLPLPDFLLLCVSKQDPPDKDIFRTNNKQAYRYELEMMARRLPRIMALREGRAIPKRCGSCDYCRATKRIIRIRSSYELSPEFRATKVELEDDYSAEFEDLA